MRITSLPLEVRAQPSYGGPLVVLDERRRGTKFIELPARSIINSPESTGMGFWSVNPYVGCEYGCTYCYARFAHRYAVQRAWDGDRIDARDFDDLRAPRGLEPFEHRIFIKARDTVLSALERDLRLVRRRLECDGTQSLLIGTGTDPYQPAERQYQLTRAILIRLLREQGLRVGIITKSPLVVRDLDLLGRLVQRHELSVYVSLVSADPQITDRFEVRSPIPQVRLRALDRLRAAGIRTGLLVAPVLPGISDSHQQLHALMRAARDASAQFVFPSPLRLYSAVRHRTLAVVERHYPHLLLRYQTAYRRGWQAPPEYLTALTRRFDRIAAAYGIPTTDGAREQPRDWPMHVDTQLSLFARSA
jgi:DNA repair photolyase